MILAGKSPITSNHIYPERFPFVNAGYCLWLFWQAVLKNNDLRGFFKKRFNPHVVIYRSIGNG